MPQFKAHRQFNGVPVALIPYGQVFEGDQIVYQEMTLTITHKMPKTFRARAKDGFESTIQVSGPLEVYLD